MARVHLYRTYRWIDKDPIIGAVKTIVQDEKLKNNAVHEITGIATATLDGWFNGGTRKPQNVTVTAVASGLGYVRRDRLLPDGTVEVGFEKARKLDWKEEAEKQTKFMLKYNPKKKRKAKRKKNGAG
jgi:hypothetical protein